MWVNRSIRMHPFVSKNQLQFIDVFLIGKIHIYFVKCKFYGLTLFVTLTKPLVYNPILKSTKEIASQRVINVAFKQLTQTAQAVNI